MAGGVRGPAPKDPRLRQRRNKVSTAARLPREGDAAEPVVIRVPQIPREYEWLDSTRKWWRQLWKSPMAVEFISMDHWPLLRLGHLLDELARLRAQVSTNRTLREGQDEVISELRRRLADNPDLVLELGHAIEVRAKLSDQLLKLQAAITKQESEIRGHEQRYGLTALDRRRLQWEFEGESPARKGKTKNEPEPPGDEEPPAADPRLRLLG